jgi:hypothetical protein
MEPARSIKDQLSRLEIRLQVMIEGSAARLFPSKTSQTDLAQNLMNAMQAGIKTRSDGALIAPNLFTLVVHPLQAGNLKQNQALFDSLTQTLEDAGKGAGLLFVKTPEIRIKTNEDVSPQQIHVMAEVNQDNLAQTTDVEVEVSSSVPELPENAFLIVNGMDVFPLSKTVINIGRRPDNQLVIKDARVSRVHAQLRAVKGRYMISDLDSTGGTFVNGQRIFQSFLFPGDVISLAGVPLVFGQETPGVGQTQKFDNESDE